MFMLLLKIIIHLGRYTLYGIPTYTNVKYYTYIGKWNSDIANLGC